VITVDEAYWVSFDGETDIAHAEAIGHHDKISSNRSVGDEVTLLSEKMMCCPRVCHTEMCGRDLVWYSGLYSGRTLLGGS
jgi:hypothetical protein